MGPLASFALIGLSAVALVPAQQGRGETPPTFGVNVDLVVLNVAVADDAGRPVSGLKAGDFEVREDHRVQNITFFHDEDAPASVGIIVDNSGSMIDKHAEVIQAALSFARASNADDDMFVITFNERASFGLPPSIPFTHDVDQIGAALLRAAPTGRTALYDALAVGLEHLNTGTLDRKVLVVLSDGGDNASRLRLDDVLRLAHASSATIYPIGIYDETDRDNNPGVLREIAKASGGRAYFPRSLGELAHIWRDVAGAIRHQYTIGYYSTNRRHDGTSRSISVTASRDGRALRVTTRDSYRAASAN